MIFLSSQVGDGRFGRKFLLSDLMAGLLELIRGHYAVLCLLAIGDPRADGPVARRERSGGEKAERV